MLPERDNFLLKQPRRCPNRKIVSIGSILCPCPVGLSLAQRNLAASAHPGLCGVHLADVRDRGFAVRRHFGDGTGQGHPYKLHRVSQSGVCVPSRFSYAASCHLLAATGRLAASRWREAAYKRRDGIHTHLIAKHSVACRDAPAPCLQVRSCPVPSPKCHRTPKPAITDARCIYPAQPRVRAGSHLALPQKQTDGQGQRVLPMQTISVWPPPRLLQKQTPAF